MGADFELGKIELLDSGRLARKVATNRSDHPVYVDSEGHTCCLHGERAQSIQCWLLFERKDPAFKRPSCCDCQNVDGLWTTYQSAKDLPWPESSESLFTMLGHFGAPEITNNTRPQRKALTTHAGIELWIQPSGTLVCKHGNTRKMLSKMKSDAANFRSSRVVKCDCTLSIPRRIGSIFAPKKKALKCCQMVKGNPS